jgi:hypothetical protein
MEEKMSPIRAAEPNYSSGEDIELINSNEGLYAQPSLTRVDLPEDNTETAGRELDSEKTIISQVLDESHFGYMMEHPVKWAFSMLTGKPVVEDTTQPKEQVVNIPDPADAQTEGGARKGGSKVAIGIIIAALVVIVGYELYGSFVAPVPHLWSYPRKKKGVVRFAVIGPYKTSTSLVDTSVLWWILKRNKCKFPIGSKQKELSRLVAHESLSFYLNRQRCFITGVEMLENCRVAVNFVTVHENQLVESRLVSTAPLGSIDAFIDK